MANELKNYDGEGAPIEILFSESEPPKQIQLFKTGTYHDPRYGKFDITPQMLLAMKKNFDEKARGIDLAVDYAHDSDKNAAAWIKSITLTDNNTKMFAEVEWTGSGKKALTDKEYRYISPDFSNNFVHNETKKEFGPTLNGAALTNRPVIKGMVPVVQLSEIEIEIEPESEITNDNKGETMDPKDQKIAELEKMVADLKAKLEGKDMSAEMGDMKKQLEEYKAKELAAVEEKKCAEQKAAFDKLLSEGKVVEAQRTPYMDGDVVKFTELAQPLKLSEKGHGGTGTTGGADDTTDAQDEILKLAQAKVATDKITLSEAIRASLKENPKLAEKYHSI